MSKWSKEDLEVWDRSEVMKELESQTIENIHTLAAHLEKSADFNKLRTDIDQTLPKAQELETSISNIMGDAEDGALIFDSWVDEKSIEMAKDLMDRFGPPDNTEDGTASWMGEGYNITISDVESSEDIAAEVAIDEPELARVALIDELRSMIKEAVNSKNLKLAYKIERTLGVILEGEGNENI